MFIGPATWQRVAPAAKGLHQSPVNIKAGDVIYDAELSKRPLGIRYDPSSCKTLINNGHSLQVVVDAQDTCELKFRLNSGGSGFTVAGQVTSEWSLVRHLGLRRV